MDIVIQEEIVEMKEVVVQEKIVKTLECTLHDDGYNVVLKINKWNVLSITPDGALLRYGFVGKDLGLNLDDNGRIKDKE